MKAIGMVNETERRWLDENDGMSSYEEYLITSNDSEIIRETLRVYGSLYLCVLIIYAVLRKHYPKLFNVRSWARDNLSELAKKQQYNFISWFWEVFKITDDEIQDDCGMDAVCFLRALKFGRKVSFMGCFCALWLIPTYYTADDSPETYYLTDPFVLISSANLPSASKRYIGTVFCAYLFYLYTMYLIYKELEWFTAYRHRFLCKKESRNYAVYVSGIPEYYRSSQQLENYFNQCMKGSVLEAHIVRDTPKLDKLVARRQAVVQKLEHAVALESRTGQTETHHNFDFSKGITRVESVQEFQDELTSLNKQIQRSIIDIVGCEDPRRKHLRRKSSSRELLAAIQMDVREQSRHFSGENLAAIFERDDEEAGFSSVGQPDEEFDVHPLKQNGCTSYDASNGDCVSPESHRGHKHARFVASQHNSSQNLEDFVELNGVQMYGGQRNRLHTLYSEAEASNVDHTYHKETYLMDGENGGGGDDHDIEGKPSHCIEFKADEQVDADEDISFTNASDSNPNLDHLEDLEDVEIPEDPQPVLEVIDARGILESPRKKLSNKQRKRERGSVSRQSSQRSGQSVRSTRSSRSNVSSNSSNRGSQSRLKESIRTGTTKVVDGIGKASNSIASSTKRAGSSIASNTKKAGNSIATGTMYAGTTIATGTKLAGSTIARTSRVAGQHAGKVIQSAGDKGLETLKKAQDVGNIVGTTVINSAGAVVPLLLQKEEGKPRDAGFVVFTSLYATQTALQMIHHPVPYTMDVVPAGAPKGIFWRNVGMPHSARRSGRLAAFAASCVLCLFWSIPMAFISSLTELNSLKESLPKLGRYIEEHALAEKVVAQAAPLILLFFNETLLPGILKYFAAWEGHISSGMLEASLFVKMGCFMIIQTFFVSLLSGGVTAELSNMLEDPDEIINFLANALPAQSSYFIQIALAQTFFLQALEILRLYPLSLALLRRFFGPRLTAKERRRTWYFLNSLDDPPDFWHAETFAQLILLYIVGFVYVPIAPVTAFFLAFCFIILESGYRYQFIHNYPRAFDTGGQLFRYFISFTLASLIIAELTLVGLLVLKQNKYAGPAIGPLIAITGLFIMFINSKHSLISRFLPTRDCILKDSENHLEGQMDMSFAQGVYLQPSLQTKEVLPDFDESEDDYHKDD